VTLSSEILVSHVAVWKHIHLNECLSKTRYKLLWEGGGNEVGLVSHDSSASFSDSRKLQYVKVDFFFNLCVGTWPIVPAPVDR
jgi:hypothetical protein